MENEKITGKIRQNIRQTELKIKATKTAMRLASDAEDIECRRRLIFYLWGYKSALEKALSFLENKNYDKNMYGGFDILESREK